MGLTSIAAGAFALAAPAAASADFEVQTLGDGPVAACAGASCTTLRDAVAAADANGVADEITFLAGLTGEITLTQGPIDVTDNYSLDITGPNLPDAISVSGDANMDNNFDAGDSQVLLVLGDGPVTVSDLTLTEGYGDAAGAVIVDFQSDLTVIDSAVTGSQATGDIDGAGPYPAYLSGGGILNRGFLEVIDSTVSGNEEAAPAGDPYGGGGIQNAGRLILEGSTVTGNVAANFGGGIFQAFGKYVEPVMTVTDSVISNNAAEFGGGISDFFSFDFLGGGRSDITNSTVSGNQAVQEGGGFSLKYVSGDTRWNINHTTISGNTAGGYGGAMAVGFVNGNLDVVDSTLSGNTATSGGAVAAYAPATKYEDAFQFLNSTITSNTAVINGGGIYLDGTDYAVPLVSTIVANNTAAGAASDIDRDNGSPDSGVDLSFSLVEAPGDAVVTQTPAGSSILGADPQLGPLAGNGGPTLTHLPAASSPVVDKGKSDARLTTDQRGFARIVETSVPNAADGTDIGSVELTSGPAPKTTFTTFPKKPKKRAIRTKKKKVKVEVTFTSDLPGATFQCKVNNEAFKTCTSPFTAKLKSKPGKGRNHTVTVRAIDPRSGAPGPEQTVSFRVIRTGLVLSARLARDGSRQPRA